MGEWKSGVIVFKSVLSVKSVVKFFRPSPPISVKPMSKSPPADDSTLDAARAAKLEALGIFGKLAELRSVGITRVGKGYGLKVNLDREPEAGTVLPTSIRGVPVKIEVVGRLVKRSASCGEGSPPD